VNSNAKTNLPMAELAQGAVSLSLLAELFDRAPDITFFVKDREGRYLVVNDSLVERCGHRTKAELIGKRVSDIFPGDLGRRPFEQDASVLRTGRPIYELLELHWYSPQRAGWCLTTKLPWRDEAGKIIGLIGISRDVHAPESQSEVPAALARALEEFESNLADPVSPAGLARRAGLSSVRFARLMKRLYRLTPSQFITKTRVTAASRLLRETGQSVADIAVACGYCDHSAFTRAFRAATGRTPTQFRGAGAG
jgi:PAS domain S-box-containing protein